jgi:CBS domain-containing protein
MSLEKSLEAVQIDQLDLGDYFSAEIGTSVKTVVEGMRTGNHNCAIITDRDELIGIFTDHDVLMKIADNTETWHRPVDDFAKLSPFTVKATDSVKTALALMDEKQFRNVPVLDDQGRLVGNLTHHSLVEYLTSDVGRSD